MEAISDWIMPSQRRPEQQRPLPQVVATACAVTPQNPILIVLHKPCIYPFPFLGTSQVFLGCLSAFNVFLRARKTRSRREADHFPHPVNDSTVETCRRPSSPVLVTQGMDDPFPSSEAPSSSWRRLCPLWTMAIASYGIRRSGRLGLECGAPPLVGIPVLLFAILTVL